VNELVERLTKEQPLIASLRPDRTVELFKAAIDRGYVHLKFTETRGGTELGVRLEGDACDLSKGNFESRTGTVKLVGTLVLNYDRVRMHAQVSLDTLGGTGRLEYLGPHEQPKAEGVAAPSYPPAVLPSPVARSAAPPIAEQKPGWTSRVFGIETARLIACDAAWDGTSWKRGEQFTFLYRSKRAKFFVLHDAHKWTHVGRSEARKIWQGLSEKLSDEATAFEPPPPEYQWPPPQGGSDSPAGGS
jgi:hypothetical protein